MRKVKDSGIPLFGRILEAWDVIITTENRETQRGCGYEEHKPQLCELCELCGKNGGKK